MPVALASRCRLATDSCGFYLNTRSRTGPVGAPPLALEHARVLSRRPRLHRFQLRFIVTFRFVT